MYRLFLFIFSLFFFQITQASASKNAQQHEDFFLKRDDGVRLRLVRVKAINQKKRLNLWPIPSKKVMVFVPGRTSCFENNYDLALRLAGHSEDKDQPSVPFDFWSLDNRGHGKSGGRLEIADGIHDQRCHIDSFETYIDDLHAALRAIKEEYHGDKVNYFLMGMSMGGNIALNYLQEYGKNSALDFKRVILISPMIKFLTPGFPELSAWALANFATYCGFGEWFIPGHGPRDLRDEAFDTYTGSHNKKDFLAQQAFFKRHSSMITEGATYGWIKAAFEAVSVLAQMEESPVPISAFLAGDDRHVDTSAAADFFIKLGAKIFVYGEAYHVLTREPEEYAPGFWKELFEELARD